jgi:excisionase family DNA binding protein
MARNASSRANGNGRRWATAKETAAYLGLKTTRTLRVMVADGRLTQYNLGPRIIRFDLDEIDAAMTVGAPRSRPAPPGQKLCSRCGAIKPVDYFGPDRRASDGLRSCCRHCETEDARDRYQARPR